MKTMKRVAVDIEKTGKKISSLRFSGKNVADLLKQLQVNTEDCIVAVNGEIVTEDEPVKNGDKVKILSVISGG